MASGPITSWEIGGETVETVSDFIFLGSKITADGDCSHEIKICLLLGRKVMTNLDSIFKSRDISFPTKIHLVPWTARESLGLQESPLDCRKIQPVHSEGDQPWNFFGRNDAKAETLVLWPPHVKSSLRLMSIKSVMPSSHLILCCPVLLLPPIPPSIRVFSNESSLRMRWPKDWSFSLSISPSSEYSGLTSFRMDWLDHQVHPGCCTFCELGTNA